MNALVSWLLAAAALVVGWYTAQWQGLAMAATLIVFWMLLQFNRAIRAMRNAASRPIGTVASAVMVHAKLHNGMTMMQVLTLTRSLGQQVGESPEAWLWADESGSSVTVEMTGGRVSGWRLERPGDEGAGGTASP
jgi:hypothetical protein